MIGLKAVNLWRVREMCSLYIPIYIFSVVVSSEFFLGGEVGMVAHGPIQQEEFFNRSSWLIDVTLTENTTGGWVR